MVETNYAAFSAAIVSEMPRELHTDEGSMEEWPKNTIFITGASQDKPQFFSSTD